MGAIKSMRTNQYVRRTVHASQALESCVNLAHRAVREELRRDILVSSACPPMLINNRYQRLTVPFVMYALKILFMHAEGVDT